MPWKSTIKVLLMFAVIIALLAACGNEDDPATATPDGGGSAPTATDEPAPTATEVSSQPDLAGTAWMLSAIGGADIDLQEPITLSFSEGQITGFSGCNEYGGEYSASESGDFTLSETWQTDMACETGMDLEADYLTALQDAESFNVIEGQRLELADGSGETLLVFTVDDRLPLDDTTWTVTELDGEPVISRTDIHVYLRAGEISGSGGCNTFGGQYDADETGAFTVSGLFWTEMGCIEPEGAMEQEQAFFTALSEVASYRHDADGGTLTLLDGNDQPRIVATVNGEEADKGIYGSPGWVAESLRGQTIEDELLATIRFDASQFAGTAGCIGYTGIIETEPGSVITRIEPAVSPCDDPELSGEVAENYMAALEDAAEFREAGDALVILDSDGAVLIVYRPAVTDHQLEGTVWTLATLDGEPVLPDTETTAEFSDGSILGSGGCNSYGAVYIAPEAGTAVISPAVSTLILCEEPAGIMDQESAYLETLRHVQTYQFTESGLEFLDAYGVVLMEFVRQR